MTNCDHPSIIHMQHAHLVRGEASIFRDLSLTLDSGQRLAILGPNGIGKTSLAMVLAGRLRLSRGALHLLGVNVHETDIRALRPRIGYFSDELTSRLAPDMTAEEVVALGRFSGLRREWFVLDDHDRLEARHLLELVGLDDYAQRPLDSLSSGQRQRVLLARSFCGTPRLTVLDEPTSHLDLVAREQMIEALERILDQHHHNGALVMVAHHLEDLPISITHTLVMSEHGYWFGPADEVLTSATLTKAFHHPIEVHQLAGRRIATALRQP
ncbi:MAG: ABC transporter ATP-binding protein [Ferrimicrobium sp.]